MKWNIKLQSNERKFRHVWFAETYLAFTYSSNWDGFWKGCVEAFYHAALNCQSTFFFFLLSKTVTLCWNEFVICLLKLK